MKIFVILAIALLSIDCSLYSRISQSRSNRHFQRNCELASEYGASNQLRKLRGLFLKFVDEPTELYVLTHHAYLAACQHGNVEALRVLVEGVGLPQGYFRMIGLGIAVRSGQADIIEYLILWGMLDNPDDLLQAIDIAESSGHAHIKALLQKHQHA